MGWGADNPPGGPLAAARAVAYAPKHRTVEQFSGEIAPTKLDDARAEVAHYAELNRVLGVALARATDTAKNAVAQEQELQDELDEVRRDSQELWERAVRVDELEQRNRELEIELAAALGSRAAWIANANEARHTGDLR